MFGYLAPTVTRRFGLERTASIALGVTAVSILLRALSPTPLTLTLSTALALAGIGAANVVIVPLVKAWFPNTLALWTSLYLVSMQTGQFLAPLLAVPVAEATNWRLSVGVWAVPIAAAAAIWFIVTTRRHSPDHRPPAGPTTGSSTKVSRSSVAWGLVGLFAMMSVSNYGIITWMPTILTDAGADLALGGTMVALYSGWGVVAAFVVPRLVTRMASPFLIVLVCAVSLVFGYLGLLLSPLNATLLWVCLLGIGVSTFPLCMTLINRSARTAQDASAVSGFVQGTGYGVACLAPIGLGLLREGTGSWTLPLLVLGITAAVGVVAGWFACRPRVIGNAPEQGGGDVS